MECWTYLIEMRKGDRVMNGKFLANVVLCGLLLAAIILGVQALSASTVTELLRSSVVASADTEQLRQQVTLTQFGVRLKKGEDRVDAIFSFENVSESNVRNIDVVCEVTDEKGRFLGRQRWVVAETVEMLSKKTVLSEGNRLFIPRQAHQIDCRIVDLESVHEPLVTVRRSHGAAEAGDSAEKAGHH